MTRIARRVVAALGLLVLLVSGRGLAQTQAADLKRIEALRTRAIADYDALEFAGAQQGLEEALQAAGEAKLTQTPVAARLHAAMAAVWIGGMRDRYRGFQALLTALRLDPAMEIDPTVATPEMLELLQTARDAIVAQQAPTPGGGPRAPGVSPALPSRDVRGLVHERVDEAWAGFDIPMRCEVGPDVPATSVLLFYRPAGREEFATLTLEAQADGWSGRIPDRDARGRYLHYYLEARDRRGRAVAQDGSAASPNLITMRGMNPRSPAATPTLSARRAALGRRFTAALGLGTGIGLLGASKSEHCGANPGQQECAPIDENHAPVPTNSGAAWAPAHLLVEGGYRLNPVWELSAQLRWQVVSGNEIKDFDEKSYLGTARLRRWIGQGRARLYFLAAAGGGQVTHAVDLGQDGGHARDTLTSGNFAIGGGAGLAVKLAGGLQAVGGLDALVLLPDNTAFNVDFSLGARYAF